MERLRAYKDFHQQSQFLMAAYLRVQNHVNTSVHGEPAALHEIKKLSTKCYVKQLKASRKVVGDLAAAWNAKDAEATSLQCKKLASVNLRSARLGKLFESPIVGGRKGPDYYTRLEEEAQQKWEDAGKDGETDWEFKPKNYPPVDPRNLSHSVREFRDSLNLFLGAGEQSLAW